MTCTIISTGEELNLVCKNEFEPPYPEIKARLREKIWELYCKGYDTFWLNCEYGVPLWSAEIIVALQMYNDIELNIAMPYEEQSTNWVEEHRERFFTIHAESDNVEIISNRYSDDCYDLADEHMIDDSELVLVVGSNPERCYGTGYARERSVKIESLDLFKGNSLG
ncbi:MAG: DUF1273 family protein [Ruminococcus sp.]|nr:DUF1273 family protein [Ruminococcus sp.]